MPLIVVKKATTTDLYSVSVDPEHPGWELHEIGAGTEHHRVCIRRTTLFTWVKVPPDARERPDMGKLIELHQRFEHDSDTEISDDEISAVFGT